MSAEIRDALRQWLLERAIEVTDKRGNPYYTRVFSGHSQPLDVRAGEYSFKYSPDVVLDRKGELFIVEVAQWEDWRSWVGEMAVVRASHPRSALYFIFFDSNKEEVDSIAEVVGHILDLDQWDYLVLEGDEATDLELAQKFIESNLKEIGWF